MDAADLSLHLALLAYGVWVLVLHPLALWGTIGYVKALAIVAGIAALVTAGLFGIGAIDVWLEERKWRESSGRSRRTPEPGFLSLVIQSVAAQKKICPTISFKKEANDAA